MIVTLFLWLFYTLPAGQTSNALDFLTRNQTRPYTVRVSKLLCTDQPYKHVEVHVCNVKLQRNKPAVFNLHFTVLKPANFVRFMITMNYKYNTYTPFLEKLDFELCSYIANDWKKGTNKMADLFLELATAQIEWIKKCPYYVMGRYNVTDFEIRTDMLPQFVPAGDFRFDFRTFTENNETLLNFQLFCNIRARGVFDLSMG
ncbi:uncharacterized protein LOC131681169 [Topomyia yanbarensis]|uniref:uncharacterized protein LOC131681169 n=1 Tax=Topomyia yanbarensis TaxID=2498891 RepID=UPI00273B29F9|nr:uncharacterized protein LOC131681169 [Topomyia yanbarensis]